MDFETLLAIDKVVLTLSAPIDVDLRFAVFLLLAK
jgi:hypothetical protein